MPSGVVQHGGGEYGRDFQFCSDIALLICQLLVVCRAVIAESEKRNIAGVLGEEIQTLHIQNRGLQDEIGM